MGLKFENVMNDENLKWRENENAQQAADKR
jgi:hypothetical protein